MSSKKKTLLGLAYFLLTFSIYRNWFPETEIIGGDWPYFFGEFVKNLPLFPPAWDSTNGNGLGGSIIAYNLDQYLYFTAQLSKISIPWFIIYKVFWFGLFLVLTMLSSFYLLRTVFSKEVTKWQNFLGVLLYSTNTYILMVASGGQMGIALAYSLAPLILARFIKIIQGDKIQNLIIASLVLGVQIMFDPRIAYITMIGVLLYFVFSIRYYVRSIIIRNTFYLLLPITIAGLLNSYWLLPIFVTRSTGIPQGFFNEGSLEFFSFADFSHAFSLLHPNWPENIFGKTYFLQPEFLILPILAYSSLLFINSKLPGLAQLRGAGKAILFFALLGLVGAFLAKGVHPPFGEINRWIYAHVPGMYLFRDPTKFYIMVVLSYTVLIPYSISNLTAWINSKLPGLAPNLFLLLVTCYLLLLVRPAWMGQLGGTFKSHEVPKEYIELKDFLYSQPDFFRTLWFPKQSRFTFVSNTHPSVEAVPLFHATNSKELIERFRKKDVKEYIQNLGVRYVIIPYDSLGEIFLDDRKYSQDLRATVESEIDLLPWLKKVQNGNLTIYETQKQPKDHFWIEDEGELSYTSLGPTTYEVMISSQKDQMLYFSENYHPSWVAKIEGNMIAPGQTEDGLMRFFLPKGSHAMEVYYGNSVYYLYGRIVSGVTLFLLLLLLLVLQSKNYGKSLA